VVSIALQGEAWACGRDQGRVRAVLGRRYAHAAGAGAYSAFLEIVVENVDAIAVVVGRAGGSLRGRAAVRAAEATAVTAAMMAAAAAAAAVALAASWAAREAAREAAAVGRQRRR
jgi:hypothetical protein